jgi:hypothetical protein
MPEGSKTPIRHQQTDFQEARPEHREMEKLELSV